ncbi:MAG: HIT family protein [Chitinophagales bacterium]|nr:HIT family protein [Bacteroidota bacterium]MBX7142188.1 HIT family protein [Chitinophagales bacterium]
MPSVFTKIINREIPAFIVAEDDDFIAFLDIFPLAKGHTLVIPKKETDYLFDIEDEMLGKMMAFAKRVAKAVEKSVACQRIGVAVIGLEVPHAHIHLIPLQSVEDINFSRPKLTVDKEEMKKIAGDIQSHLQ